MPELAFITQVKDEPMALIVFVIIAGYKFIEILAKHIIPFLVSLITHTKKRSVEEILAEDAQKRIERQSELDRSLDEIKSNIDKLFTIVADHEEFTSSISQGTLENMVFNEALPPFRRLKAFRRLIAMKGNGRAKKKGMEIVLNHKETWLDVLDINMPLKIVDQNYYDNVLAEIDRRILSLGGCA